MGEMIAVLLGIAIGVIGFGVINENSINKIRAEKTTTEINLSNCNQNLETKQTIIEGMLMNK